MASSSSSSDDEIVGINVTPLVDVTLVLLIIFMVTAKLVMSQALPLDLPVAATAGETQTMLTVSLAAEGALHVNGEPIAGDAALAAAAREAQHEAPELRVVISASTRASHGRVMHLLDVLRGIGISKVAFAADVDEHAPAQREAE